MNWLSAFSKVGEVALSAGKKAVEVAKSPVTQQVVKAINPVAGVLLASVIQGINNVQEVMPGPENNDLKKKIVVGMLDRQATQLGVELDAAQTEALIEGILKALQTAANTPPSGTPVRAKL